MKWGLIISGPRLSYGQGPNKTNVGYDSNSDVIANLKELSHLFEKVVLVTWVGEDFKNLPQLVNFEIHEFWQPVWISDPDNRRKQLIALQNGIQLFENSDLTHVIRIRSDQRVSQEFIQHIQQLYLNGENDHLIFNSEWIPNELFYSGDFLFAGEKRLLLGYCGVYLDSRRKLHPVATKDYVLKWLVSRKELNPMINLLGITAGLLFSEIITNQRILLWDRIRKSTYSYPTRALFESIVWRGKSMRDISNWESFGFAEESISVMPIESDFSRSFFHKLKHILIPYYKTRYRLVKREIKKSRFFRKLLD
jgi:hypothetical protein